MTPCPSRRSRPAPRTGLVVLGALAGVALATTTGVRRVEVMGTSMAPALEPGDRLAALRLPAWLPRQVRDRLIRPGAVVVLRDPRGGDRVLIKRVARVGVVRTIDVDATGTVTADGVVVLGDARDASTDSRTFGPIAATDVLSVVLYRYGPAGRSGALAGPGTRRG